MGVEGSNLNPPNMMHTSTHGRLGKRRTTRICSLLHRSFYLFYPCRATHVIYRFDGELEPGFFQHVLIRRVEQSTIAGIVELCFQERSMKADHCVVLYCSALYRIVLCSRHVLCIMFHASCFMPHFELHVSCFVPHAALLRVMLHVMLCAS